MPSPFDSYVFYRAIQSKTKLQKKSKPIASTPVNEEKSYQEVKAYGATQYTSFSARKHSNSYLDELEQPKKSTKLPSKQEVIAGIIKKDKQSDESLKMAKEYLIEEITHKICTLFTQIIYSTTWNEKRQTEKRMGKINALKALLALIATHDEVDKFDNHFLNHFKISLLVIYPEELRWEGINTLEELETSKSYTKYFKFAFKSKIKLVSDVKDIFLAAKTYFSHLSNLAAEQDKSYGSIVPRLHGIN